MAVFLPGGIQTARLRSANLNETLLNATTFDASTILIADAPGYELDFFNMDPNYVFDLSDCSIYGKERGEGLLFCVGSSNSTIMAGAFLLLICANSGWSICPTDLYSKGLCHSDMSWTDTLQQTTSLNIFKRYSTVVYDRQNLSILSIESISPPVIADIDPESWRSLCAYVSTPGANITSEDTEMTNSWLFQVGWFLRLMQDEFQHDSYTPLNFLRGVLTVPIQFSVSALQFANATLSSIDPHSTRFALPADLEATASGAKSTYRAMTTQSWTVYAFISTVAFLLLWGLLVFVVVYAQNVYVADTSNFSEVDVVSKSGNLPPEKQRLIQDYCSALRDADLGNGNSRKIAQAVEDKNIRLVEVDAQESGKKLIVLIVGGDLEDFPSLSTGFKY